MVRFLLLGAVDVDDVDDDDAVVDFEEETGTTATEWVLGLCCDLVPIVEFEDEATEVGLEDVREDARVDVEEEIVEFEEEVGIIERISRSLSVN